MGAGLHGQEREMSLLHSVVFHMGGKVHTVRFVPLHMHACAFQKRTKNPPTVEHTPMHVHTLPADVQCSDIHIHTPTYPPTHSQANTALSGLS